MILYNYNYSNWRINVNVNPQKGVRAHSGDGKKIDKNVFISNCFDDIQNLISNNKSTPYQLQEEIETYLFNYNNVYTNDKFTFNFDSPTSKWVLNKRDLIITYLDNMLSNEISNSKKLTLVEKQAKQTNEIVAGLTSKKVANMLISFFLEIAGREFSEGRLIQTEAFAQLGKKLISLYIFTLYSRSVKGIPKADQQTLSAWKSENRELIDKLSETLTSPSVGGNVAQFLTTPEVNMIELDMEYGDDRKYHNIIKIQDDARAIILKENQVVYMTPPQLPMMVKPKPYKLEGNDITLGGYLKNDVFYTMNVFIEKGGYRDCTALKQNNDVIALINGINSVQYKINKDTLDFVNLYGVEKGIILDLNAAKGENLKAFRENPYKRSTAGAGTKRYNKEMRSIMSKMYLQKNILSIAETYQPLDTIYFPIRLDQRTRFYCSPDYLNYQSTDLAKGLISYSNPGHFTKDNTSAINYFKSYGATLFNNDLGKKSLASRIKWVDANKDYLLNFESNDIINKSESKVCFVSFCFEYKRFSAFMDDLDLSRFATALPIQLDASCNGYQHISLLTRQEEVFKHLNLKASTQRDAPEDFYNYMLFKVRDYISDRLKGKTYKDMVEAESLTKLLKVELSRSMVKKAVMTYSYNTSLPQMIAYIAETLHYFPIKSPVDEKVISAYSISAETQKAYITNKDISYFVICFISVIKQVFPKMSELKIYLRSIVGICTRLNLPIPWVLPSGAVISQSYLQSKKLKVKPFAFINSKYSFKFTVEDKFDLRKQSDAIMPNLIHSLDACSIALLYKELSASACGTADLYVVHDCFAVTADKVELLINLLKGVYIKIYSDDLYLVSLDSHIKNTLINILGSGAFTKDFAYIYIETKDANGAPSASLKGKKEKVPYPTLDKVIDKKVSIKALEDSSYIID